MLGARPHLKTNLHSKVPVEFASGMIRKKPFDVLSQFGKMLVVRDDYTLN